MRAIALGIGLGLALLGAATNVEGSQYSKAAGEDFNLPDTISTTIAAPHGLERLQPGVPVRASWAPYGDSLRPVTLVTGTFLSFQVGEAFEMEVPAEGRTQIHQIAIEDLISIEVGRVRRATTSGSVIGIVSGVVLGMAATAIAASETPGDADYGAGAAVGGLLGGGLGALLGYRSTEIEYQKLPLYGPVYDDPPADPD